MEDRIPPQNIEAEQSVLGAMLISGNAIDKATEILKAEDFYRQDHQTIFTAITDLHSRNEAADIVTVTEALRKMGKLDAIGGTAVITALSNAVPTAANVEYHAKIVAEKSLRRQMIDAGTEVVARGYDDESDIDLAVDLVQQRVLGLNKSTKNDIPVMKELVKNEMGRIEEMYDSKDPCIGLPTGFKKLDLITSGLQAGDLIILAGRPAMGKTALALNIINNVILDGGKHVAFFSLEMPTQQIIQRLLSVASENVSLSAIRTGTQMKENGWPNLVIAADKLSEAKLEIIDSSKFNISNVMNICSLARKINKKEKLDLVVIDYLQRINGDSKKNRNLQLEEASRAIKSLALELNVPVILLSQLNRSVESRDDKRPGMADLRDSGAIEQDADVIILLYRDEYYNKESKTPGVAELLIKKQRNGPTGTVSLAFRPELTKFYDLPSDKALKIDGA